MKLRPMKGDQVQRIGSESLLVVIEHSEITQLKQARALLSGDGTKKTATPAPLKKHKMSAASGKKIADAQRKRWAKQKAAK